MVNNGKKNASLKGREVVQYITSSYMRGFLCEIFINPSIILKTGHFNSIISLILTLSRYSRFPLLRIRHRGSSPAWTCLWLSWLKFTLNWLRIEIDEKVIFWPVFDQFRPVFTKIEHFLSFPHLLLISISYFWKMKIRPGSDFFLPSSYLKRNTFRPFRPFTLFKNIYLL